jgi:adenylate cyclase
MPAAILAADVAAFSRLAADDEERTVVRLGGLWSDLVDPAASVHHGRVVKRTGDGVLIEFHNVVDAVRCAVEIQSGMVEQNIGLRLKDALSGASVSISVTCSSARA